MLIFSPMARQVIEDAVTLLDGSQQQIWTSWSSNRTRIRGPGDSRDDGEGPLPADIVNVVFSALDARKERYRHAIGQPGMSEDDISDLDNDLTHIRAIERAVYDNLSLNGAAA